MPPGISSNGIHVSHGNSRGEIHSAAGEAGVLSLVCAPNGESELVLMSEQQ